MFRLEADEQLVAVAKIVNNQDLTPLAKWLVLLVAGALTLYALASPLLSNLRADELFFMQCAYSALHFDSAIIECHRPATFAKVLKLYLTAFGLTGSVLAYKTSVAVITVGLLGLLFSGVGRGSVYTAVPSALVIAVFLYYIASNRGIEIRQEFYAIALMLIGASPLIGHERWLDAKGALLSAGFIAGQLLLSIAALMSLRFAMPAMALGAALFAAQLRVNNAQLISMTAVKMLCLSCTLAIATLALVHFLFLDLAELLTRLVTWSPPPHHHSTFERTYLYIGLLEQIQHLGWDSELWRYQRLVFGSSLALTLAGVTWARREWRVALERLLLIGALGVFWHMLSVEAMPFAYVVAVEGALCLLLWCACANASRNSRAFAPFMVVSAGLALLLLAQSHASNSKVRNMTISEFQRTAFRIKSDQVSNVSTSILVSLFRHRHFMVQLAAREEFCRRYRGFTVVSRYALHPICLPDAGSHAVWTRKTSMEDLSQIVDGYPNFIIGGFPQFKEDPRFNLGEIGQGFFAKGQRP